MQIFHSIKEHTLEILNRNVRFTVKLSFDVMQGKRTLYECHCGMSYKTNWHIAIGGETWSLSVYTILLVL